LLPALELMSLASEYRRQFGWRDWSTILDALPSLQGQTVLDLGCGVGDLAAELVARGAHVIGVEMNEELLRAARARQLPNAEFRAGDLRGLRDFAVAADGLWCSFVAAYFPDLPASLTEWAQSVRSGGWIALTEVDDLFGHAPLSHQTQALFRAYANEALATSRYDFHMGRKLGVHLERSGFAISKMLTLEDQELSFNGPARLEVLDAWRSRFKRMKSLREFCGPAIDSVEEEFLDCLQRADHTSGAKVHCCIAIKEQAQE